MNPIITAFLLAIAEVENTPNNPYGLSKDAIADVNRFHKCGYKLSDRRDKVKAGDILMRYISIWWPDDKAASFDVRTAARIVRGGPTGPTQERTLGSARRVENLTMEYAR